MSAVNSNHFTIPREQIEQNCHVRIPKIYDDKVVKILERLKSSLEGRPSPSNVKSSNTSWFGHVPSIHIDNSTNIKASPFSYVNASKTKTVVVNDSSVNQKNKKSIEEVEKDNNEALMKVIAIVSAVVLATGSYLIGLAVGSYNNVSADEEDLKELKRYVKNTKHQIKNPPTDHHYTYLLQPQQKTLLDAQIERLDEVIESPVFNKFKSNAKLDLALRITLVTGAIFGLIGSLMATKALIVTGGVLAGVTTISWLVKKGMNSKENGRMSQKIQDHLAAIDIVLKAIDKLPKVSLTDPAQFDAHVRQHVYQPGYYDIPAYFQASAPAYGA